MTHENPNQNESSADEQETNNHAKAIAAQLRLAEEETLEEIGADPDDHFTRASELDDDQEHYVDDRLGDDSLGFAMVRCKCGTVYPLSAGSCPESPADLLGGDR